MADGNTPDPPAVASNCCTRSYAAARAESLNGCMPTAAGGGWACGGISVSASRSNVNRSGDAVEAAAAAAALTLVGATAVTAGGSSTCVTGGA